MNPPKISVIIPTYNRAHLIKNTIVSVINQTFKDWELLVVDDGSTDNTKSVIQELADGDKRIHYFYQEASGGPSSPRNLGIDKAVGEYVAFLDSDDEWFPTKLERQLDLFEKSDNPKLGVVSCFADTKDSKTGKIIPKNNKYFSGNAFNELLIHSGLFCTTSCTMTKLSILKEVGKFDNSLKFYEDLDLWLRVSLLEYEVDYVQEYLLNYIVHDDNIFYGKYGNEEFDEKNQFKIFMKKNYKLYLENYKFYLANKYSYLGDYLLDVKEYKLARKFLLKELLNNRYNKRIKMGKIRQIIITYYPPSEKIWQNIKKIFKK